MPAAFGVRTTREPAQRDPIGIVQHGDDVRYQRDSLDEAAGTLVQSLADLTGCAPGTSWCRSRCTPVATPW